MHLMEGSEGKHGVPIASRKNELRSSSICRAFVSKLVQWSMTNNSMFLSAQLVMTLVPFWMKSCTIFCSSSLAWRKPSSSEYFSEVVSSHFKRRLLGILLWFLSRLKLSFFFSMILVRTRLVWLSSLIGSIKTSCCDKMSGLNSSSSVVRVMSSVEGLNSSEMKGEL